MVRFPFVVSVSPYTLIRATKSKEFAIIIGKLSIFGFLAIGKYDPLAGEYIALGPRVKEAMYKIGRTKNPARAVIFIPLEAHKMHHIAHLYISVVPL